mmetsp:Transcript_31009/g.70948  ORF Transcript_31009/g.70948 Transcript_31009/m.70948 type:complete len:238 (+) Transcript_31009:124-837(+)
MDVLEIIRSASTKSSHLSTIWTSSKWCSFVSLAFVVTSVVSRPLPVRPLRVLSIGRLTPRILAICSLGIVVTFAVGRQHVFAILSILASAFTFALDFSLNLYSFAEYLVPLVKHDSSQLRRGSGELDKSKRFAFYNGHLRDVTIFAKVSEQVILCNAIRQMAHKEPGVGTLAPIGHRVVELHGNGFHPNLFTCLASENAIPQLMVALEYTDQSWICHPHKAEASRHIRLPVLHHGCF